MALSKFDQAALNVLRSAGIKPTTTDVKLLGDDLQGIADEELDASDPTNCVSLDESAGEAQAILRRRIGGWQNLESYMRCLRVPNRV